MLKKVIVRIINANIISKYPEVLFLSPTTIPRTTRKDVKYTIGFRTVEGYPISSRFVTYMTNNVTQMCRTEINTIGIEITGVFLVVSGRSKYMLFT